MTDALRDFIRLIGDLPLNLTNQQLIEEFKIKRLEEVSPTKVNIDFRSLKAAFGVALKWNLVEKNPCTGCKPIRVPNRSPQFLTAKEFDELMKVIPQEWFRVIVRFALTTMMRVGEIVHLRWESGDFTNKMIIVENTVEYSLKTRKRRCIPMDNWIFQTLLPMRKSSGRVFVFPNGRSLRVGYISHMFKKYVLQSGILSHIHFHSLGHTSLTWMHHQGVPSEVLRQIAGHSSIVTTYQYTHALPQHLLAAANKLIPCVRDLKLALGQDFRVEPGSNARNLSLPLAVG